MRNSPNGAQPGEHTVDINILCHLISAGKREPTVGGARNSLVFNNYFFGSGYGTSDH